MLIIEYVMIENNVRILGLQFETIWETGTMSSYLDDILK